MRAAKFIGSLVLLGGICICIYAFQHGNSNGKGITSFDNGTAQTASNHPSERLLSAEVKLLQDQAWGRFRRAFPFQMQVIAVSKPYPDRSRTLIVSEPPPDVTLDELKAADADALATCEIKQHTVGSDGWVRDAVFNLPPGMDDVAVTKLVQSVTRVEFGTDYGAYALPLPVNLDSLHTRYPLDLHIGVPELQHWIAETAFQFTDGTRAETLSRAGTPGIYYSQDPGVVAMVLPPSDALGGFKAQLRRFALDSDLILGAAKINGQTIVLGRERVIPVDVMPPLRSETIAMLAGAGTDKLAQSYERTSPFSGKFKGAWDWAPSYLSPQLIDTEYGSLLNVADQLLKSWSESGEVRYENFNYADPTRFPFRRALARALGTSSLLFNWNTTGVGFTVDIDPSTQIYGLYRTGALPVIYRPDQKNDEDMEIHGDLAQVKQAEEIGYQFYASQNDPVLARVVQYAALYQCFRAFNVDGTPVRHVSAGTGQNVIHDALRTTLAAISKMTDTEVRKKADDYAAAFIKVLADPEFSRGDAYFAAMLDRVDAQQRIADDASDRITALRKDVIALDRSGGQQALDDAADLASASRETDPTALVNGWNARGDGHTNEVIEFCQRLPSQGDALCLCVDLESIRRNFLSASNPGTNPWLHTQSIVVSCDIGESVTGTGGHNLDAAITKFCGNPGVAPGDFKLLDDGTIELNPNDLDRAQDVVRIAARDGTTSEGVAEIKRQLQTIPAQAAVSNEAALETGGLVRTGRGFNPDQFVPQPGNGNGPNLPPHEPPDGASAVGVDPPAEPPHPAIGEGGGGNDGYGTPPPRLPDGDYDPFNFLLVEKRSGKVFIYKKTAEGEWVAESWNFHTAHIGVANELQTGSRFRNGAPLELRFGEGFDAGDYDAFIASLDVQLRRFPSADRVLVFREVKDGMEPFNAPLKSAMAQTFHVTQSPDGLRVVDGSLMLTRQSGKTTQMSVEASLEGTADQISDTTVNKVIAARALRVTNDSLSSKQLGIEIYQDLEKLSPGRRAKNGIIRVEDAGDFTIVLQDKKRPGVAGQDGTARQADLAVGNEVVEHGS